MREGPVDSPRSPEAAVSTYWGRQSSTIGGAARSRKKSLLTIQPLRTNTPSSAKAARKATRMSSRTECAANAVSAAASEGLWSIVAGWWAQAARASARVARRGFMPPHATPMRNPAGLQNVTREVLALRRRCEAGIDVGCIHGDATRAAAGIERDVLEQLLHHRVEAARADVLGALVDRERDLGQPPHAIGRVLELHALGGEQRLVLAREAGVGGGEDALEVLDREARELHADRQAPLQLGDQVRGAGEMEGAARDEKDVIRADHAVLGGDGRALDQGQQVALHALAGDVGALQLSAARDLVDLVDEDDAVLLDRGERLEADLLLVHELGGLLLGDEAQRLADAQLPALAPPAAHVREHALDLLRELLHPRRGEDLHGAAALRDVDLDLLVVELALAQHLAETLARGVGVVALDRRHARQQGVEHAFLGDVLGARAHLVHFLLARALHRDLRQVAHDGVDVATDVAHLGELGGLDLDEGRVREPRQAPRDLGLAHARGADHQDVLGRDLAAQRLGHLRAAPAVPQRDRHRALGLALPDDVLVELVHDLLRRHHRRGAGGSGGGRGGGAHSVSITWFWLV